MRLAIFFKLWLLLKTKITLRTLLHLYIFNYKWSLGLGLTSQFCFSTLILWYRGSQTMDYYIFDAFWGFKFGLDSGNLNIDISTNFLSLNSINIIFFWTLDFYRIKIGLSLTSLGTIILECIEIYSLMEFLILDIEGHSRIYIVVLVQIIISMYLLFSIYVFTLSASINIFEFIVSINATIVIWRDTFSIIESIPIGTIVCQTWSIF